MAQRASFGSRSPSNGASNRYLDLLRPVPVTSALTPRRALSRQAEDAAARRSRPLLSRYVALAARHCRRRSRRRQTSEQYRSPWKHLRQMKNQRGQALHLIAQIRTANFRPRSSGELDDYVRVCDDPDRVRARQLLVHRGLGVPAPAPTSQPRRCVISTARDRPSSGGVRFHRRGGAFQTGARTRPTLIASEVLSTFATPSMAVTAS